MFDLVRSSKDLDISLLPAITLACRQERGPVIRVNRAGEPSRRWRLVSQSTGGTDGSQTLRWREPDSNHRSRRERNGHGRGSKSILAISDLTLDLRADRQPQRIHARPFAVRARDLLALATTAAMLCPSCASRGLVRPPAPRSAASDRRALRSGPRGKSG